MRLYLLLALLVQDVDARNPHLARAQTFYNNLEYEKGLESVREALVWKGTSLHEKAEIYVYMGLLRANLGDEPGAKTAFREALSLNPRTALPSNVSPKVQRVFSDEASVLRPSSRSRGGAVRKTQHAATLSRSTDRRRRAPTASKNAASPAVAQRSLVPAPTAAVIAPATREVPAPAAELGAVATAPGAQPNIQLVPALHEESPGAAASAGSTANATVLGTRVAEQDASADSALHPSASAGTSLQPARHAPVRWPSFLAVGVAAGLAGAGGYFGLSARSLNTDAAKARYASDANSLHSRANSNAATANLLYGFSGAAAAAGVALFFAF